MNWFFFLTVAMAALGALLLLLYSLTLSQEDAQAELDQYVVDRLEEDGGDHDHL